MSTLTPVPQTAHISFNNDANDTRGFGNHTRVTTSLPHLHPIDIFSNGPQDIKIIINSKDTFLKKIIDRNSFIKQIHKTRKYNEVMSYKKKKRRQNFESLCHIYFRQLTS